MHAYFSKKKGLILENKCYIFLENILIIKTGSQYSKLSVAALLSEQILLYSHLYNTNIILDIR